MDKHPALPRRKQLLEAAIRVLDLFVYALAFFGGVALAVVPPESARQILHDFSPVVAVWAALLLGGGLVGFIGRLTRYWMVENTGTVAAAFGGLIYVLVLGSRAMESFPAAAAWAFVSVGFLCIVRRWLELQIFGSEPGDWRHRLTQALHRRTANMVNRSS